MIEDELTSGAEYTENENENENEILESGQAEAEEENSVYHEISVDELPIADFVGIGFLVSGTGLMLAISVSYFLSLLKRA